jgi:hypothetical protein
MVKDNSELHDLSDVLKKLTAIENRLSKLERTISVSESAVPEAAIRPDQEATPVSDPGNESIESNIGEYGMAWLGNIVLFFCMVFLLQFLSSKGYGILSDIIGFAVVCLIYLIGHLLKKEHAYISRLFSYNGHLLLFIAGVRLHFITENPLITGMATEIVLLTCISTGLGILAFKRRSQLLTVIAGFFLVITAVLSDSTHFMLPLMAAISGMSVIYIFRFGWWKNLFLTIFLTYTVFLMWSLSNPVMSHTVKVISSIQYSYIYLMAVAFIFSMLALLKNKDENDELLINLSIILNGIGFSSIIAMLILIFFKTNYYLILGLIAAFSIAYSALLQSRGVYRISAALYALYGFASLSIAIGGIYKFPLAFFLLSIQSLFVVSMALWFRSRFIVIMNVFMFIGLLTAYLVFPNPVRSADFAFAIVALVSARIINWKKDRLEIRTELMRNTYLILGFIMTLLSLYRAVPKNYVTLSWTLAAGLFFVLSLLLNNVKYRWLAISVVIVTAIYFFLFDLRHISVGLRVVALLFIAVISLSFSAFYARKIKKRRSSGTD